MLSESVVDRMVAADGGSEGDDKDWPALVAHNGSAVGSIVTGGAAGCRETKHRVQAAGNTTCGGAHAGGKIGTRSIGSSGTTGRAAWVVVFNAGAKASFSIAFRSNGYILVLRNAFLIVVFRKAFSQARE